MTILESLIKLRNDLKLWVANNLRMKADKTAVEEMIIEAKEDASNKDVVILAEVQAALESKVDKEEGKGLSSNDFTNEEKEKLASHNHQGQSVNPTAIEINPSSGAGHGGYIDFHYNGDTSDYTTRIIEAGAGNIIMNISGDETNYKFLTSKDSITYTVTVPTSWTASGNYYYEDVAVTGIMSTDNPIVDINPSSDNDANILYSDAICKVFRITTSTNSIRLWSTENIDIAFPIQLKVVR